MPDNVRRDDFDDIDDEDLDELRDMRDEAWEMLIRHAYELTTTVELGRKILGLPHPESEPRSDDGS